MPGEVESTVCIESEAVVSFFVFFIIELCDLG